MGYLPVFETIDRRPNRLLVPRNESLVDEYWFVDMGLEDDSPYSLENATALVHQYLDLRKFGEFNYKSASGLIEWHHVAGVLSFEEDRVVLSAAEVFMQRGYMGLYYLALGGMSEGGFLAFHDDDLITIKQCIEMLSSTEKFPKGIEAWNCPLNIWSIQDAIRSKALPGAKLINQSYLFPRGAAILWATWKTKLNNSC